jgi:hypothetical protein
MIKQEITIIPETDDIRLSRETTRKLQQWQAQTLQRLQQEPGSPHYPIRWTSLRQKRAFFASDGFGRGIPTRRTHALSRGWDVFVNIEQIGRIEAYKVALLEFLTRLTGGAAPTPPPAVVIVSVDNPVKYEQYVTGIHQQGFHQDTGWQYTPDILNTAFKQAEGIVNGL